MSFDDFMRALSASKSFATAAGVVVTAALGAVSGYALGGVVASIVMTCATFLSFLCGYVLSCHQTSRAFRSGLIDSPFNADKTLATNMAGLEYVTPAMAQAIVALMESPSGTLPASRMTDAVRSSIENRDGVFYEVEFEFMGAPTGRKTGDYALTKRWRDYANDAGVLSLIRKKAGR